MSDPPRPPRADRQHPLGLALIGPAGSGKGTQARLLAERCGLVHVEAGELLRREVAAGTDVGRQVSDYLRDGKLAPDHLTARLIGRELADQARQRGFVLDGFPRSMAQVNALEPILDRYGLRIDAVIWLEVSDQVALERLQRRARPEVPGAPPPSARALRARLSGQRAGLEEVAAHYSSRGLLRVVSGLPLPEEVYAAILRAIGET